MLAEWRRRQSERGQTLAEYHVIFSVVSLVTVVALAVLGVNLIKSFASIACNV